jgi:hypothetical protein
VRRRRRGSLLFLVCRSDPILFGEESVASEPAKTGRGDGRERR